MNRGWLRLRLALDFLNLFSMSPATSHLGFPSENQAFVALHGLGLFCLSS